MPVAKRPIVYQPLYLREFPIRQYRYVMASSDGTSYDFARHDLFMAESFDLPELLADGWRPLRETPMGEGAWLVDGKQTEYALVLILLEKKIESPKKGGAKKSSSD